MDAGRWFPSRTLAIADTTIELLDNDRALQAMRKRAYLYARHMVWDQVAQSYMRAFIRALTDHTQPVRNAFPLAGAATDATNRSTSA